MKTASALIVAVAITISSALLLGQPKTSAAAAQSLESRDSRANAGSIEEQIVSKEREGVDALKTGNLELFGNQETAAK